jgi:cytochrome c5
MRYLDKANGTPSPPESPAAPGHCRRHGIAGLALLIIVSLPVAGWSSNGSTGAAHSNPAADVSQTDVIEPHVNKPPLEGDSPVEVDTGPASSGKYDLALGKSVFNHTCLTCHGNIVSDAPLVGDMHVWQSRLAQGLDVLIQHARDGHGRMPAKGGYTTLTDHEVSSAVAYVYQVSTEILAKRDNTITQEGCDPDSESDQCSPEEMKRLLALQMLWLLLGGPHQ